MTKRKPVEGLVLTAAQARAWLVLVDTSPQELATRPNAALCRVLGISPASASETVASLLAAGAIARVGSRGLAPLMPADDCVIHRHPVDIACRSGGVRNVRSAVQRACRNSVEEVV